MFIYLMGFIQMKIKNLSILSGAIFVVGMGSAQAALINDIVITNTMSGNETMTWSDQNLNNPMMSDVTQEGDVTSTMGSFSGEMMDGTPVWDYSWNLMSDPDPFISGNFTVTNTSSMMQTFDITFGLPISPSFTSGYMTGSLSGSYVDANNDGSAMLSLNSWEGLIDGASQMSLLSLAGPCMGAGCSVSFGEVTDGPILYTGGANNTIGIHMNFGLSAGDSVTFDTLFDVTPVPVPAAVWLFGSGLIGLAGIARRKKA